MAATLTGFDVTILPVTPFAQNCTVLRDRNSRDAVVIDPGGDAERILALIAREGLSVSAIWLTHGHLDHAGGVAGLKRGLSGSVPVPVLGPHAADGFLLREIAAQAASYGIAGLENAESDRFLTEGEEVSFAGHRFAVLHCPGHTPGHVVFYNAVARFAQVGDVLFAGSVGRTDFPYGDHAALIGAITTKLLPLGDDVRFVCGHGRGSDFGTERRGNPFLQG